MEEGNKKEEEEEEAAAVADFLRKEVKDWDDEAMIRARFKALSGQRPDWEPLYLFWRDLILKVARHRQTFIIRPSHISRLWFRHPRSGVSPLSLQRVLLEMHNSGELLSTNQHPTSSLVHIFRKALNLFSDDSTISEEDEYILAPLLEEQALCVVDSLLENHWTASCIVTMSKFRDICRGSDEALAILNHLSRLGRARHLVVRKPVPIEGVKVCLAPGADSVASSTDYSVLHLLSTLEKLEQQLDSIDQQYQKTRKSALDALKSGNKRVALRCAKELKLVSQSRERCAGLLDRVEGVLQAITDAESTKKVSEAIQNSTNAIRGNLIPVEEVELCLQEVAENIDSLTRLDDAIKQTPGYGEMDDEDVEDEFNKLQLEIKTEMNEKPGINEFDSSAVTPEEDSETADVLSQALSNLDIKDGAGMNSMTEIRGEPVQEKNVSKEGRLEAA